MIILQKNNRNLKENNAIFAIEKKLMSETNLFRQKHSAAIRIWHWLSGLVILASLVTVLLGSTFLKGRNTKKMVSEELAASGTIITEQQARDVAHAYNDIAWDLHKYIGYGLAFLLLSRFIIEFTLSKEEKFRQRMKSALKMYKLNDTNKKEYQHYLIAKWSYVLFYVLLTVMVLTGLGLAFEHDVAFLEKDSIHEPIKDIHGICQYVMYAFIFFHAGGVIRSDIGKHKGIVSGMINGNK